MDDSMKIVVENDGSQKQSWSRDFFFFQSSFYQILR